MTVRPSIPEDQAAGILATAIAEGRAGELLDCLFDGGSCTVDPFTGRLVLARWPGVSTSVNARLELVRRGQVVPVTLIRHDTASGGWWLSRGFPRSHPVPASCCPPSLLEGR